MVSIRRVLMLGTLTMLGAALSGCIVLPYGARHGRHGHHARPSAGRYAPGRPAGQCASAQSFTAGFSEYVP